MFGGVFIFQHRENLLLLSRSVAGSLAAEISEEPIVMGDGDLHAAPQQMLADPANIQTHAIDGSPAAAKGPGPRPSAHSTCTSAPHSGATQTPPALIARLASQAACIF